MNVEQLLKELEISQVGNYSSGGSYIIDISSSNEFGRVYSKLEDSDKLDQSENSALITLHDISIIYKYEDQFQLTLLGDLDNDTYKLVIEEI